MNVKFLPLLICFMLSPFFMQAQSNFENTFQKAKDAYFKNDFELALTHFEKIEKMDKKPKDTSWQNYYRKCQNAYIRSLKKDIKTNETLLQDKTEALRLRDSLYKETSYSLSNKNKAYTKLEAEKLVIESLSCSPSQKWQKAALVLEASHLNEQLNQKDQPEQLFSAILSTSLLLGERSWEKEILKNEKIQFIDFDEQSGTLRAAFANGQTAEILNFMDWINFPDSLFTIELSNKIDLPYPIQDWSIVPGQKSMAFAAGPKIYVLEKDQKEPTVIFAHEKNYIKGIVPTEANTINTFGSDNFINKIDLQTKTVEPIMGHSSIISDVLKTNNNKTTFFTSSNGALFKVSGNSAAGFKVVSDNLPLKISKINIFKDLQVKDYKSDVLLCGQENGFLTFYELKDSGTKYIRRFDLHKGKIQKIQATEEQLFIYSQDGIISIWDIDEMLKEYTYKPISFQIEPMIKAIDFVPSESMLVYGNAIGEIKTININIKDHLSTVCSQYQAYWKKENENKEQPEFLKNCQ